MKTLKTLISCGLIFLAALVAHLPEVLAAPAGGKMVFAYADRDKANPNCLRGWGFSPVVSFDGKTILFNAGGIPRIMKHNFQALGLDPKKLDALVISHHHYEMVEGIDYLLKENPDLKIYTTGTTTRVIRSKNPEWAKNVEVVGSTKEITPNIILMNLKSRPREGGPFGIYEVHMILKTGKGLVILQGCGHPFILNIVQQSKKFTGESRVNFVGGGTRLLRPGNRINVQDSGEQFSIPQMRYYSDDFYSKLMDNLKAEGVEYVMPTHCTQQPAESFFLRAFGSKYINHKLGMTLKFPL
ncbi:MAG: hypothetical protein ACE5GM_07935 [bacterium]